MKPKTSENQKGQLEFGRVLLADFLNMNHQLVRLTDSINWEEFDKNFGQSFHQSHGRPGLPTQLMVGLTYLKYLHNFSDEAVVEGFLENGYWQYFCGFKYFQHEFPCDASSLTRWRKRLGEKGAEKLLQETLAVAHKLGLLKPQSCKRVIVDTTVQEKNISHPTDIKLINKARENLVKLSRQRGIALRQSYKFKGKEEAFKASRYLHARQFNRANRSIKKQRTWLGRVIRDIGRKCEEPDEKLVSALLLATRVRYQTKGSKNKIYSLHEPHVECLSKGKARCPYEFGNKVSFTVTARGSWVIGAKSFFGNPFDGSTLREAIGQTELVTGVRVNDIFVDKGYRGKVHHPEGKRVLISGRRRLRPILQRLLKRRSSVEPVIGHIKEDHRMARNWLGGKDGDEINPIFAASAFNLRKILRSFFLYLFYWLKKSRNRFLFQLFRPSFLIY